MTVFRFQGESAPANTSPVLKYVLVKHVPATEQTQDRRRRVAYNASDTSGTCSGIALLMSPQKKNVSSVWPGVGRDLRLRGLF